MAIYANVTYKFFNGKDWDTYYFKTSASSVIETTEKRFLNPTKHLVNGKSFFNGNTPQGITLCGSDIHHGQVFAMQNSAYADNTLDETFSTILNALNSISSRFSNYIQKIKVGSAEYTPNTSGEVDLATEFNKYLLKSGGTITGNLTVQGNLTIAGTTMTVNSTNLEIEDQVIVLAKGNTTNLTKPVGFIVPKYDGANYGGLYFDNTGTAYVGDVEVDSDGNIVVNGSKTTALPLVVRTKNVTPSANGKIAIWKNSGQEQGLGLDYAEYTLGDSFGGDSDIATYKNIKGKVAAALKVEGRTLKLIALDGQSVLSSQDLPSNGITVSETAPTAPRSGDIWIDTSGATTVTA